MRRTFCLTDQSLLSTMYSRAEGYSPLLYHRCAPQDPACEFKCGEVMLNTGGFVDWTVRKILFGPPPKSRLCDPCLVVGSDFNACFACTQMRPV